MKQKNTPIDMKKLLVLLVLFCSILTAKAEQFELTEENVEKYINAIAMTDKNFFCNDSHNQKFEQYNDVYCYIWIKG